MTAIRTFRHIISYCENSFCFNICEVSLWPTVYTVHVTMERYIVGVTNFLQKDNHMYMVILYDIEYHRI